jgi:Lrp/AsnC family transcriptional regulator, leucine-responsive regulatory protein
MIKLDKKDKKILTILTDNARASVSEVARKTGIPRDSVHYRIQRLVRSKVIERFHTYVDPVALGFPVYTFVTFTLNNFDGEDKFYQFLATHPNIVYVAKTTGKWDCIIAISARTLEHFDEVFRDIRKHYSAIIKDYETSSLIHQYKYDYMVDLIE